MERASDGRGVQINTSPDNSGALDFALPLRLFRQGFARRALARVINSGKIRRLEKSAQVDQDLPLTPRLRFSATVGNCQEIITTLLPVCPFFLHFAAWRWCRVTLQPAKTLYRQRTTLYVRRLWSTVWPTVHQQEFYPNTDFIVAAGIPVDFVDKSGAALRVCPKRFGLSSVPTAVSDSVPAV